MGCIMSLLPPSLDESKTYLIVPKLDPKKCLGCAGKATAKGTQVILWERIPGTADQEWKVKKGKFPGMYVFSPVHAADKALDVAAAKEHTKLGDKATEDPSKTQTFVTVPVPQEDGFFFIQLAEAKLTLDLFEAKTENGTAVVGWEDFHKGDNQKWKIQELVEPLDVAKTYNIVNKGAPNKVVGCASRATENGTKVVLWDSDSDANQKWKAVKHADNKWSFVPQHATDKQLDNPNAGEQCHLWETGDGKNANQLFTVEVGAEGFVFLKVGDRVLAAAGGDNGANLVTSTDFNKSDLQQWKFAEVK